MGILDLFRGKNKLPIVVQESIAAMKPQIDAARTSYSSAAAYEARLVSDSTTMFLHGFILLFAAKHGVSAPEHRWAATVQTFQQVF